MLNIEVSTYSNFKTVKKSKIKISQLQNSILTISAGPLAPPQHKHDTLGAPSKRDKAAVVPQTEQWSYPNVFPYPREIVDKLAK